MTEKQVEKMIKGVLKESFEEFSLRAYQSGKQETSRLFAEIKEEVKSIKGTLQEHTMEIHALKREVEQSNHIDENLMKLHVEKENQHERSVSDTKYAIKLVEKIVFWGVSLIGVAFLTALISQVIPQ